MGKRTGKGQRARQESRTLHAAFTPRWDGGFNAAIGVGRNAELNPGDFRPDERTPGEHYWTVMVGYRVDIDKYDESKPGGGLGILSPDKIDTLTPVICSECATVYTPEERNTRCTGEVPG